MKSLFRLTSAGAARSVRVAILLLGFFIVVMGVGGLAVLHRLGQMQEGILTEQLAAAARGISERPPGDFWFLPLLTDPETGVLDPEAVAIYSAPELQGWSDAAAALASAEQLPAVSEALLLTPQGEVIMDSEGEVAADSQRERLLAADSASIAEASAGSVSSPRITPEMPVKRLYAPILDEEGVVVALVRVAVNENAFEMLRRPRNRLLLTFLISTVLLVALYIFTARLIRRTLEAERAISQADRLRALGTLTAGIAHEIRNPLGIISLQAEELKAIASEAPDGPLRRSLDGLASDLKDEIRRLRDLTESFLAFSRSHQSSSGGGAPMDGAAAAHRVFRLFSKGLDPERRKVEFQGAESGVHVRFSEDRLRQVLLNLLRNADEALGSHPGTIRMEVEHAAGKLLLRVRDNGPGIAPSDLEQIFDPFFTTRAEGTGLGLPLSRSMLQGSGGDLTVESKPGQGAAFTIILPLAKEAGAPH